MCPTDNSQDQDGISERESSSRLASLWIILLKWKQCFPRVPEYLIPLAQVERALGTSACPIWFLCARCPCTTKLISHCALSASPWSVPKACLRAGYLNSNHKVTFSWIFKQKNTCSMSGLWDRCFPSKVKWISAVSFRVHLPESSHWIALQRKSEGEQKLGF